MKIGRLVCRGFFLGCKAEKVAPFSCLRNTLTYRIMSSTKHRVIFVLGGPGAGKGTQCSKLVEKFGFVHLSAGDLLRKEKEDPNSEFGPLIEEHMVKGSIVPVHITCSLLAKAMRDSSSSNSKFLIDGFPRNWDNLMGWNKEMDEKAIVEMVLWFHCDKEICTSRCLERGLAGSGRSDDNLETLERRFETYLNSTLPIIQHYEKQNLVRKIDSSQSVKQIFEEISSFF